jgi:hypothetical protein
MLVERAGNGASEGWRLGLLSLSSVKRSLGVRMVFATATVAGAAAGAALGGARGAVIAGAIVMPLCALTFRHQFLAATRFSGAEGRRRPLDLAQPEPFA